jgi:hypothetical protein
MTSLVLQMMRRLAAAAAERGDKEVAAPSPVQVCAAFLLPSLVLIFDVHTAGAVLACGRHRSRFGGYCGDGKRQDARVRKD